MSDYNGWKVELEEAQGRIRELEVLLDECERFIESRTCMCIPKLKCSRCEILDKLRKEQADE